MPFLGLLHLLIAIGFVIHAQKTGRPQFWMYVLIFVPLVGSIAYVIFELLPEAASSRRAQKVATNLRTVVDPHRDWRKLNERLHETDTVEAKYKYAEECERKGMWDDAIAMYEQAAQGIFADDPDVLRGLARAQLGSGDPVAAVGTLDKLRAAHPDYQHQDAHLTYARAMEVQGRIREAEREYRALSEYFVGFEAKTRYAMLLEKMGEHEVAKMLFGDVVKASKARGIVRSDNDRKWINVARKNA